MLTKTSFGLFTIMPGFATETGAVAYRQYPDRRLDMIICSYVRCIVCALHRRDSLVASERRQQRTITWLLDPVDSKISCPVLRVEHSRHLRVIIKNHAP